MAATHMDPVVATVETVVDMVTTHTEAIEEAMEATSLTAVVPAEATVPTRAAIKPRVVTEEVLRVATLTREPSSWATSASVPKREMSARCSEETDSTPSGLECSKTKTASSRALPLLSSNQRTRRTALAE